MNLRAALIPVALVAGLSVAAVDAQAAPISPVKTTSVFGPRIHVGGGIGFDIPIGVRSRRRAHRSHRVYAPVVHAAPSGYYRTVRERVWHEGELMGYDRHGHPLMSAGHWDVVERQVWVPAPRVVHRPRVLHRRSRPVGNIHVGVGFGRTWHR